MGAQKMQDLTVAVLEDDVSTRSYLVSAIEAKGQLSVIAHWGSLQEARDWFAAGGHCSALLLDIGLPDGNGISLIPEIRKLKQAPEIMVITVFSDPEHLMHAIDAGAAGYMLKDAEASTITESVLHLLAGGSPISPSVARYLLNRIKGNDEDSVACPLTYREHEVLLLISKGLTSNEVADILDISYHTITTHVRNIYKKLSVRTRSEAVFEAQRRGYIKLTRE